MCNPARPAPSLVNIDPLAHFVIERLGCRDISPRRWQRGQKAFCIYAFAGPGTAQDERQRRYIRGGHEILSDGRSAVLGD
jgi:hypothetical protein